MRKVLGMTIMALFILAGCTTTGDTTPHTLGSADAKVTIQEFSDPECPACASISPQMEQFVRDNPELARLEYYHYPLSYHEYAFIAAEASECAGDQGKFWEYIGMIFQTQRSLNEDHLYKVADSLDLDRTDFDLCMDENRHKGKILAHMAKGSRLKVPGTPSFFVNGQLVKWSGAEAFKAYLESL